MTVKFISFFFIFFPLTLHALEVEKKNHNELSLSGALDSNSAWEVQLSYTRIFTSWLGAGVGLNMYHQYSDEVDLLEKSEKTGSYQWQVTSGKTQQTGLQLNPYIHLNTPNLFKIEDAYVRLFAEPGCLITFLRNKRPTIQCFNGSGYTNGSYKKDGGDWLFWNFRLGASIENNFGSLSIGYIRSNMDFYSQLRDIKINGMRLNDDLPKKETNWGVFIALGIKF